MNEMADLIEKKDELCMALLAAKEDASRWEDAARVSLDDLLGVPGSLQSLRIGIEGTRRKGLWEGANIIY